MNIVKEKIMRNEALTFEDIKDNLFVRLKKYDPEEVSGVFHEKIEDLALIAYCVYEMGPNGLASFAVPRWICHEVDVMKAAKENAPRLFPAELLDSKKFLDEMIGDSEGVDEILKHISVIEFFENPIIDRILTNTSKINGAAALFYPGMMEKLHEEVGDCYLLPSSKNEFLIIAENSEIIQGYEDVPRLKSLVAKVNADRRIIAQDDVLTDSLYMCKNGEFVKL